MHAQMKHSVANLQDLIPTLAGIKTQSSVSVAKKTKKDVRHTSVLFTDTAKLPNSAFCISKTTKPISTKCTVRGKILEGENFGEFGERLAIRQNFSHQYL